MFKFDRPIIISVFILSNNILCPKNENGSALLKPRAYLTCKMAVQVMGEVRWSCNSRLGSFLGFFASLMGLNWSQTNLFPNINQIRCVLCSCSSW